MAAELPAGDPASAAPAVEGHPRPLIRGLFTSAGFGQFRAEPRRIARRIV